jgi:hypothetical protein
MTQELRVFAGVEVDLCAPSVRSAAEWSRGHRRCNRSRGRSARGRGFLLSHPRAACVPSEGAKDLRRSVKSPFGWFPTNRALGGLVPRRHRTRVIVPILYRPNLNQATDGISGLGDINPSFLLSPALGRSSGAWVQRFSCPPPRRCNSAPANGVSAPTPSSSFSRSRGRLVRLRLQLAFLFPEEPKRAAPATSSRY